MQSLDYVSLTGSYSVTTNGFGNYLETDYTCDPMGRAEATISPAGAVAYTVYNGLGQATGEWAGTTTKTSPSDRSAVIAAFRTWVYNPAHGGSVAYSATGIQLYKTSSSVYNTDGDVTATTQYVDSTSSRQPR